MTMPPKPPARPDRVSLWRYLRLFRADILSAQPARLYRAKMAEFRTPFFRSFMINEPPLIHEVLRARPLDFPKSTRVNEGLRPLLGDRSVFLTNGADWQHQRRLIDPVFEGGRLRETFPAMLQATRAAVARLTPGPVEIEAHASHATADVIFRTLFSLPIEDQVAAEMCVALREYQRSQPILNIAAFLPLPRWIPRGHRGRTRRAARSIRARIALLTDRRLAEIAAGNAPDDLATGLLSARDPETGQGFGRDEMIDQVAIFFLAGHETSASALAWALYLLATHPDIQARAADEARALPETPAFSDLSKLRLIRDVFRETLRLYPPVPMMVRATTAPESFRNRDAPPGAQVVISPWHLHRNDRYWSDPDRFDPDRFARPETREAQRNAYLPFSLGTRVCPGAGFAQIEAALLLSAILRAYRIAPVVGRIPKPVAHLTVRAQDGIWLELHPRGNKNRAP